MAPQRVLVVGGSGFLGSAIVKQAVSRGWEVVSISPSGRPFTTPAGHQPGWATSSAIQWRAADALKPETYIDALRECSAVVHTIGILLEADYKPRRDRRGGGGGGGGGILQGLAAGWGWGRSRNPLDEDAQRFSYEVMNRDSALGVARTFLDVLRARSPIASNAPTSQPAPFVYISAEDIFRPIVSERYIRTKREAEYELGKLAVDSVPVLSAAAAAASDAAAASPSSGTRAGTEAQPLLKPFFVRPGLMYHPQTRPLSTLPAALLDLSASVHARLDAGAASTAGTFAADPLSGPRRPAARGPFGIRLPTPARLIRALGPASVQPLADLLTLPPLHVDTVAKAVCAAIAGETQTRHVGTIITAELEPARGGGLVSVGEVLGTHDIRALAGWKT